MKHSLRKFVRNNAGATAIEFAFVVGPLILLVFGAIEFSRLMWAREALQSAAIAGARCMGVRETACAPAGTYSATSTKTFIRDWALNLYISVPDANITISNAATTCPGSASGFSRVSITYNFNSLIAPFLDAIDQQQLSATACFPNQPVT
jgi:Flp pilus assembly protein TadG